jgi:hypothetical protein
MPLAVVPVEVGGLRVMNDPPTSTNPNVVPPAVT